MTAENSANLYFPFFYNYYDITESMSDEEFGRLVRIVMLSMRGDKVEIPKEFKVIYNFIVDGARRVFESRIQKRKKYEQSKAQISKPKERCGDFDAEAAFKKALERTYGEVVGALD